MEIFTHLIVGLFFGFIIYGFYVVLFSFITWMSVDAAKNDKFWWVVFIIGVPGIGAVVYYFVEKHHDYVKLKVLKNKREAVAVDGQ